MMLCDKYLHTLLVLHECQYLNKVHYSLVINLNESEFDKYVIEF